MQPSFPCSPWCRKMLPSYSSAITSATSSTVLTYNLHERILACVKPDNSSIVCALAPGAEVCRDCSDSAVGQHHRSAPEADMPIAFLAAILFVPTKSFACDQ